MTNFLTFFTNIFTYFLNSLIMNALDIVNYRKKMKLTQEEFGKMLGVSGKTVSNWETTGNIPTPMRVKLENLLNEEVQKRDAVDHVGRLLDIMEADRATMNADRQFYQQEIQHNREQLDINDITYKWLLGFRAFIEEQTSKGSRAVSYYLSCLRHIHNLAREEYNDEEVREPRIPRQPFRRGLIPPQPVTKHRTLTVEQLRSVIAYEPVTDRQRVAQDMFVLSFALIGMNTVDLYHLTSDSLTDGVINYNRCKTDSKRNDKALMRVRVEPEAERLILQHKGRRALLDFADRYANHRNFNKAVNKGLDEIQTALGIDDLSSYYARHTWATLARNACGIDRSTVDEALNHASRPDERLLDIYVERDWSRVWDANRKVLDYVFSLG